ncbi:DUF3244 domain-containing protein [Bacteroides sp.]
MKKSLLLTFIMGIALSYVVTNYVCGMTNDKSIDKLIWNAVPLKKRNPDYSGDATARSSGITFAQAYINEKTLLIEFLSPLIEDATIIVTNTSTGEVIYSESYVLPDIISINMDIRNFGHCQVEIVTAYIILWGDF